MTRKIAIASALSLAAVKIAEAHEGLHPHAHPHPDWSQTIAILLAIGAFAALFLIPLGAASKARSKRRDPR